MSAGARALINIAKASKRELGTNLGFGQFGVEGLANYPQVRPAGRLRGGKHGASDLVEGGYFALRGFLAKSVSEAARHIAVRGVGGETAPILLRLMSQIAARFGLVVSQKIAAQAIPVLGALGGAAVNLAFAEHFQSLAGGHFIVRRLQRTYGHAPVRAAYGRIAAGLRGGSANHTIVRSLSGSGRPAV
jgi:hypothetical protein